MEVINELNTDTHRVFNVPKSALPSQDGGQRTQTHVGRVLRVVIGGEARASSVQHACCGRLREREKIPLHVCITRTLSSLMNHLATFYCVNS